MVLGPSKSFGVINSIEFQIKKFFELPNVLDSALNELAETDNDIQIKNFSHGNLKKLILGRKTSSYHIFYTTTILNQITL